MAYKISDDCVMCGDADTCISCGSCEGVCPVGAPAEE